MKYGKFKKHLEDSGVADSFVSLCLKRIGEVELRYGEDMEALVVDDDTMIAALKQLEWKVEKNDLDNYQNALKHYYHMVHGHEFPSRGFGNRRIK